MTENVFNVEITKDDEPKTNEANPVINYSYGKINNVSPYKVLDVYFQKANGEPEHLDSNKITIDTISKLAFALFEDDIYNLSDDDKETFPVFRDRNNKLKKGITIVEKRKKNKNEIELAFQKHVQKAFYINHNNIFSNIPFVQECLKRFGDDGDKFVLKYKKNTVTELSQTEEHEQEENQTAPQAPKHNNSYIKRYSEMLIQSKNLILRGAPGTGKTYLAKQIAADIISNGTVAEYKDLSEEQKKQVAFVQFHPSYDYTDFVEGLRPTVNDDKTMGFELKDGIFKAFVDRARKNYEDAQKSVETLKKEISVQKAMDDFFDSIEFGKTTFHTYNKNNFTIIGADDAHIDIFIPENAITNKLSLNLNEIKMMLESDQSFDKVKDIKTFFGKNYARQQYSYYLAIYKKLIERNSKVQKAEINRQQEKRYIFIIDEINRGEISKIFGELFFSIDPGYRGKAGEISTQYANLHSDSKKFYIPDNVYIIGTMNDIDRSVDSFDFAMRRRFRFVALKANECTQMLESLADKQNEAIKRMTALNEAISKLEDLNENYHIGPSYFLKLQTIDDNFDILWEDYLQPLLQDYIQGMHNEKEIMRDFEKAYEYNPKNSQKDDINTNSEEDDVDGNAQN